MLDKAGQKDQFLEYINEEYDEIRQDYYNGLKENKYVSLEEARRKKLQLEWNDYTPCKLKVKI